MEATQPEAGAANANVKESMVDPFLVEALHNPRHRLTILRMELDIRRFLQNPDQRQFEFQHFPTSYLRLAAHRVAQHYGLVTMVQDSSIDGLANKIIVRKAAESRYPAVCLYEIPAKESDSNMPEHIKIVIKPRHRNGSANESSESGVKRSPIRRVEERKEEYDKARARIFNTGDSPTSDDIVPQGAMDNKPTCLTKDENEGSRNCTVDPQKNVNIREGTSSRVAIFRDREKDRTDPDYDRSYERYVKSLPINQSIGLGPFNMPKIQVPYVQYDTGFPQLNQVTRTQASLGYNPAMSPVMSPFSAVRSNQTSGDAAYEPLRHAVFQAPPFCQQPLSFDYLQNQ